MTGRRTLLCGLALAAAAALGSEPEPGPAASLLSDRVPTPRQERQLVSSLLEVRSGRIEEAIDGVSHLVERQPDFHLAHLVRGDLLLALSGRLSRFAQPLAGERAEDFRAEARARLRRYLESPPSESLPEALLRVPSTVGAALVVDLASYRLYAFAHRQGRLTRVRDFYVSIGKGGGDKLREGDEKTPVGVYRVTGHLPGSELPDLYGVGAFPISYPNGWDRSRGRTGSGIWIHGTEWNSYSRPPQSSLGCVTLSNADFEDLARLVEVGRTPVVVADRLRWNPPDEIEARREGLERALERWRLDWESRDAERYLSHYSASFRTPGMSRAAFAAHKRRVNRGKRYIRVTLEDRGIFAYPGEQDLVLVEFLQRYASDSFRAAARKQQYWRLEDGTWRIVFENRV